MHRSIRLAVLLKLVLLTALSANVLGAQTKINGHTFTLPDGFEIELVAGPPLVERPIEADFDHNGHLYVTDSSGSNDKVEKQLVDRPHRVVRLVDSLGDGHFDKANVFADKLMFPEGAMWRGGSLYVAAPPSIWKLTDTKDQGVADRREEWFQGKTLTNCANDLHGPYSGPDGWIYWCKGAFAEQTYPRPDGKPFVTKAAHVFRCRPDGTGIEPVLTGGMDNPIELAFTPGGERIITTTFVQNPAGGKRDAILHAIYGGVYGKIHNVIDGHPRTDPDVMPVMTHLGPAAPCGLLCYQSTAFGPEYQGNLFATQFNLHKVSRHVLVPQGATFETKDEDFLVSDNNDFHPTDVLEDADGSLLVLDTGGWYKICCPTSQLSKPDVLGAIYRIRRHGAPKLDDPRGREINWVFFSDGMTKWLSDPRPIVRRRAMDELSNLKPATGIVDALLKFIKDEPSAEGRRNAVWTATRIDAPEARAIARQALSDKDETVRQVALHSISVRRDDDATKDVAALLSSDSLQNRRAAAEALGRIGDKSVVPALLAALGEVNDRVLEHSLTYALIEIAGPEETRRGLTSDNPLIQRAALMALDQMPDGGLQPEDVLALASATQPRLRDTANWIVGHHPEWSGKLAEFFRVRLDQEKLSAADRATLERQLGQLAPTPAIRDLLAAEVVSKTTTAEGRKSALRAMSLAPLKNAPDKWVAAYVAALADGDDGVVREAVAAIKARPSAKTGDGQLSALLLRIADRADADANFRLAALAALPGGLPEVTDERFAWLQSQLNAEQPVVRRGMAADVLSRAALRKEQLIALAEAVKSAGPLEIDRLLTAYERTTDVEVGRKILDSLRDAASLTSLRADALKVHFKEYGKEVAPQLAALCEKLNVDAAQQSARLDELSSSLPTGEIRRGQQVFNDTKAACTACHAIGYLGGNIGPDLTSVGKIRTERDLLESIVYPSASFVRSYEPLLIRTTDGHVINGLVRQETSDAFVLATGPKEEVRVAKDDIEEMRPGTVSIMPAGLDKQLTPQQLADLVAFLKSCK